MTQTTESKRYNGWTNYETWAVKLWMDSALSSQTYWLDTTREVWADSKPPQSYYQVYRSQSEYARITLADRLKDEHEQHKDLVLESAQLQSSIWADLLSAALGEVDWFEIADSLLADAELDGYEAHS